MNLLFKRVAILLIAMVTMNVAASAQAKGDMAVGGNLLLGTGDNSQIGIGAKFFYNVTEPIRLVGEFDFFPKKNNVSMWDLSVYGHYLFPVAEKITLYPSVGLGLLSASVSIPAVTVSGVTIPAQSHSSSDFALSLGGGIDYELSSKLILSGELRFKIKNGSSSIIALGLAYRL
ncbi:MAG: porin family protein [Prevotellaceae bacterium]|jgi:opacity protein-like surface antigen|nr:porin family protein [Prevotellaceae bacterium]